ncbi:MAG TPA: NifU family protein [Saprospiraceae bacterium]|nr:NifU family protein [Saprospiraceae bacterium]
MTAPEKKSLLMAIDKALDDVRPHLAIDGGDVEVVDVTHDMHVRIKWLGNCENCSMSALTMKAGIQDALRNKIPGIQSVEAIN